MIERKKNEGYEKDKPSHNYANKIAQLSWIMKVTVKTGMTQDINPTPPLRHEGTEHVEKDSMNR